MGRIGELCKAAAKGDLGTCRSCLAADSRLIHSTYKGMQPIHWAARKNRADVVKYLIDNGADVNALGGSRSWTPLHYSARLAPNAALVLIENNCDLNAVDSEGNTPLALAISEQTLKSEEIGKLLTDAGAYYGLIEATAKGDLERVREILTQDPIAIANVPSKELLVILLLTVEKDDTLGDRDDEILKLLFDHGLKVGSMKLLMKRKLLLFFVVGIFGIIRFYFWDKWKFRFDMFILFRRQKQIEKLDAEIIESWNRQYIEEFGGPIDNQNPAAASHMARIEELQKPTEEMRAELNELQERFRQL